VAVLSVRNANIVFGGTAEELGILIFELEDFFLLISLYFLFVAAWPRRDAIAS